MTNPEVEGLDGNAVRRIIQEVLGADFRLPGLHANQIAAKVNARLTHPLPDGEGGVREKVVEECADVCDRYADKHEQRLRNTPGASLYHESVGHECAARRLAAAIRSLTTSEPRT